MAEDPLPALPAFRFVTGNAGKVAEAERILGQPLEVVDVDLPEIQSADLETVLRAKLEEALHRVGPPVVVEETGLGLRALNGFPGPLVKWFLHAVGAEGIARTALALGDASALARCLVAFADGNRVVIGHGEAWGLLVLPPRGKSGFGWDPVFEPLGEQQTYAELGSERKDQLSYRGHAWRDLARQLRAE